jgi:Protein of unknown function (DUF3551)
MACGSIGSHVTSKAEKANTADRESEMNQLFNIAAAPAAAAVAWAIIAFATTAPATAGEYCRKDISSAMVSCSFDTLEQCHDMSFGRGGDCFRDPFLPNASNALAYAPKSIRVKPAHKLAH